MSHAAYGRMSSDRQRGVHEHLGCFVDTHQSRSSLRSPPCASAPKASLAAGRPYQHIIEQRDGREWGCGALFELRMGAHNLLIGFMEKNEERSCCCLIRWKRK
jgi:hypothetical protein